MQMKSTQGSGIIRSKLRTITYMLSGRTSENSAEFKWVKNPSSKIRTDLSVIEVGVDCDDANPLHLNHSIGSDNVVLFEKCGFKMLGLGT